MTERIAAAAIHLAPLTLSMPPPARHHNLIRQAAANGIEARICSDMQGFVTSIGRFVDRREAMLIARAQGQLIPRAAGFMEGEISSGDVLFSEDVW